MTKKLLDEAIAVYRQHGETGLLVWYEGLSLEDKAKFNEELQLTVEHVVKAVQTFMMAIKQVTDALTQNLTPIIEDEEEKA